ncbi:MAG: VacJ family lipoprotein [Candidatus Pacebacteria bacterium]|nr:VacJ family lipoprotein [Candidatus Paceibacterota bacterium]
MKQVLLFCAFMSLFLLSIMQTGCAKNPEGCVFYPDPLSDEEQNICEVADPLEPINRVIFVFNDKFYMWVLEPINENVYKKIPEPARDCIGNFFYNLFAPVRIIGAIMQGKGETAGLTTNEFVNNSLFGIAGIFRPAKFNPPDEEDLDQGLAHWGFGEGFYIVWPIFGPKTLRSSFGSIGEYFISPTKYTASNERFILQSTDSVDLWNEFSPTYKSITEGSIDEYTSLKKAYVERQRERLRE